jgi:hypothetical protein
VVDDRSKRRLRSKKQRLRSRQLSKELDVRPVRPAVILLCTMIMMVMDVLLFGLPGSGRAILMRHLYFACSLQPPRRDGPRSNGLLSLTNLLIN